MSAGNGEAPVNSEVIKQTEEKGTETSTSKKVRVRTVKVQGPVTCKGHGPMQPLAERMCGVSEEEIEEKRDEKDEKYQEERRTLTTQTEVTYQFWKKNSRYEKKT